MNLPDKIHPVPEFIRRANAIHDLAEIAEHTSILNEVNGYALEAAHEVVAAPIMEELSPEAEAIQARAHELFDAPPNTGEQKLINMIDTDSPNIGVSRRSIATDVLKETHPDFDVSDETSETDEKVYKLLSGSQMSDNRLVVQGNYARFMAEKHITDNTELPVEALELARYKAFVAHEASRGRFQNKAEVDAWKEHQLNMAPTKSRAVTVANLVQLFAYAHTGDDGAQHIDPSHMMQTTRSLMKVAKTIDRILDPKTPSTTRIRFDNDTFDERLREIMPLLEGILQARLQNVPVPGRVSHAYTQQLEKLCSLEQPNVVVKLARRVLDSATNYAITHVS